MWRPSPAMRVAALVFGLGSAAFSAWVVAVASEQGAVWVAFAIVFVLVFFIVPAVSGVLWAFRAQVELTPEALVVVTTFSERHFPWEDVRHAEPGYAGITITLGDGGTFLAGAIQKDNLARRLGRRTRADRLTDLIRDRAKAA